MRLPGTGKATSSSASPGVLPSAPWWSDRADTRSCLHLPGRHTSNAVRDAVIEALGALPQHLRQSLTWDQGSEMALHAEIVAALGMPVYFCQKASPWQRPSNENTNGLLRQYFPRAATYARTTPTGSPRWPPSSTPGPARRWAGTPRPRAWPASLVRGEQGLTVVVTEQEGEPVQVVAQAVDVVARHANETSQGRVKQVVISGQPGAHKPQQLSKFARVPDVQAHTGHTHLRSRPGCSSYQRPQLPG